jgi:hypothetical protein
MKKIFIAIAILCTVCLGMEISKAQTTVTIGWLGADALTAIGTIAVGSSVVVNSNAGPLRTTACSAVGGATGAPVATQPTPMIGATVKVVAGPSLACANGIIYWQVQFGTAPPPPVITNAAFVCTPTFQPVTMATFIPTGVSGLQFSVLNSGKTAMTISAVNITDPSFALSGLVLPITVPAGGTQIFTIKFVPSTVGKFAATVNFSANVPGGIFSMGVVGVAQ